MNENMQQKAAETHRVNIQRSLPGSRKAKGMKPDSPAASRNELLQLELVDYISCYLSKL